MRHCIEVGAVAAGLCLCAPVFADEPEQHFADVPVGQLVLVDSVASRSAAVIEAPDGQSEIIFEGDLVGREKLRVVKVVRGCLSLSAGAGQPTMLCVDAAAMPRS